MATEFGAAATAATPVANNVQAVEGVSKDTSLLQGVGMLFDQAGEIMEGRRETRNQQFLTDFTNKQLLVTDALEQGRIRTSAQARTMMRRNFLDAIEANPGLRDDLLEAHRGAIGFFGSTDLINNGTVEEQRRENRVSQLVTAGLLDENHTDADFEAADSSAQIAVAAQERYDSRMDTLNLELTTGRVSDARRAQIETVRTEETRGYLRDVAPLEVQTMTTQFNAILNGAGSESEKVQAMQDYFLQWRSQATAKVSDMDSGEFSAFLEPFEQLQDIYVQRATGEITDQEVKRASERIVATGTLLAMQQDQNIANLAVASGLFSDSIFQEALVGNTAAFNSALRFLAGTDSSQPTPSPFVTDSGDKDGMRTYLEGVLRGLESDNPETQQEAGSRVGVLLESIEDYEGLIRRDPKAGIALVNWLSSPDFLAARAANPEQFANAGAAAEVIKNHYDSEVWGMVREQFLQNNISVIGQRGGGPLPQVQVGTNSSGQPIMRDTQVLESVGSSSAIGTRATSSGMEFYALEGYASRDERGVAQEVRRLNEELAPVINNTLKASAHINGESNYGELWDQVSQEFLSGEDQLGGGDAGDDLSANDFLKGAAARDILEDPNTQLQVVGGTRADYDPSDGTMNISMDFNASSSGTARGTEVIIPDNAGPDVRAAADKFNQAVVEFARANGIEDYPVRGVRTTSENGRGVRNTMHVEPFFNNDEDMQRAIQADPEGFAKIYLEAFGRIPARLVNPHGVGNDRGASSSIFGDETSFGELMTSSITGN